MSTKCKQSYWLLETNTVFILMLSTIVYCCMKWNFMEQSPSVLVWHIMLLFSETAQANYFWTMTFNYKELFKANKIIYNLFTWEIQGKALHA